MKNDLIIVNDWDVSKRLESNVCNVLLLNNQYLDVESSLSCYRLATIEPLSSICSAVDLDQLDLLFSLHE